MGGFLNEANVEVVIHRALGRTGSQMVSAAKKMRNAGTEKGGTGCGATGQGCLGLPVRMPTTFSALRRNLVRIHCQTYPRYRGPYPN